MADAFRSDKQGEPESNLANVIKSKSLQNILQVKHGLVGS
ncbi:hypothetical protein COLO4_08886 [Corchorus olitorius]|uniref:Uncharacterized protein n=1 Tax=Corchorus olitorius TaxID=93759 RepID=A0A1R3KE68_9ROSI|nr:hypothetical protein COLO4_08886 [Corchorus olitorius]